VTRSRFAWNNTCRRLMCNVHHSRGSLDVTESSSRRISGTGTGQSTHDPVNDKDYTVDRVQSSTTMFTLPSLILLVFVIQLAIHLISTFGGQAINDLVYSYYSHPNQTNDNHTDHSLAMAPLHQTPRPTVQTSRRRCNPPQRSRPTEPRDDQHLRPRRLCEMGQTAPPARQEEGRI
jgi:hypothetical protein